VASFHGIILGYSRQIYAQARSGYLPAWFAEVHPRFKTPHRAIVAGGVVGIAAIFSDELLSFGGQSLTANIVTMAVLGALLMYVLSMAALFKLRASEPGLPRPYRVPFYPIFPAVALIGAVICLVTVAWFNPAHGPLRAHPGPGLRLLPAYPRAAGGASLRRACQGRRLRAVAGSTVCFEFARRCSPCELEPNRTSPQALSAGRKLHLHCLRRPEERPAPAADADAHKQRRP
jgi:hypothetical protein